MLLAILANLGYSDITTDTASPISNMIILLFEGFLSYHFCFYNFMV